MSISLFNMRERILAYFHDDECGFLEHFCDSKLSDDVRVENMLVKLTELDALPFYESSVINSKSYEKCIIFKDYATQLIATDPENALLYYTKYMAAKPPSDDEEQSEIGSAFFNRSCMSYRMKIFDASLCDLKRAYDHDYPITFKYTLKVKMGKCYQKLGKMREAKTCFKEALKALQTEEKLSDDEKTRIVSSIEKVLSNIPSDNSTFTVCWHPLPNKMYGNHSIISCATTGLAVIHISKMGRGIVATRDLYPGDVIIVEKPYVSVLSPSCYVTHCYHCMKKSYALIPCKHCSLAMFCSESCREASWQTNHEVECKFLSSLEHLRLDIFEETALLALRMFLVASNTGNRLKHLYNEVTKLNEEKNSEDTKGFNKAGKYNFMDYSTVHFLSRWEPSASLIYVQIIMVACVLLNFIDTQTNILEIVENGKLGSNSKDILKQFVGRLLLQYLCISVKNSFFITDVHTYFYDGGKRNSKEIAIGLGLYPTASLLNHSCDPNVTGAFYHGDTQVLIANQTIAKGDQLFISYGVNFTDHAYRLRQDILQTKYNFDCVCKSCTNTKPQCPVLSLEVQFKCKLCQTPFHKTVVEAKAYQCDKCGYENCTKTLKESLFTTYERLHKINIMSSNNFEYSYMSEVKELVLHLETLIAHPCVLTVDARELLRRCLRKMGNNYVYQVPVEMNIPKTTDIVNGLRNANTSTTTSDTISSADTISAVSALLTRTVMCKPTVPVASRVLPHPPSGRMQIQQQRARTSVCARNTVAVPNLDGYSSPLSMIVKRDMIKVITSMLLELGYDEVVHILTDKRALRARIMEAFAALTHV